MEQWKHVKIVSTASREVITFSDGTVSSGNSLIIPCICSVRTLALNFCGDSFSQISCFGRCNHVSWITGVGTRGLVDWAFLRQKFHPHNFAENVQSSVSRSRINEVKGSKIVCVAWDTIKGEHQLNALLLPQPRMPRSWVDATIGSSTGNSHSGWREIPNALPVIHWVRWGFADVTNRV